MSFQFQRCCCMMNKTACRTELRYWFKPAFKFTIAGGKLSWSFSDVFHTVSRCGSYCDMYGQLVPAQQCGPHQTCCGDLRMRTCCYTSDVERSDNLVKGLWKDASCDGISNVIADHHDNDDDDSDDDDPTSKVSSTTTQALTIMDIPTMQWVNDEAQ